MKILYIIFLLQGVTLAASDWYQNISEGRGFLIALIGMTIVFCGLVLISLVIRLMIHFLEDRKQVIEPAKKTEKSVSEKLTEEELLAIVTALNLSSIYIEGERQRLTWEASQLDQSSWSVTGRVQTLSKRSNISRLKG